MAPDGAHVPPLLTPPPAPASHAEAALGPHAKAAEVVGAHGGLFGGRRGAHAEVRRGRGRRGLVCCARRGGCLEERRGGGCAGGIVWRVRRGGFAALAHGTEAFQPPPRAAYGNFFEGWVK